MDQRRLVRLSIGAVLVLSACGGEDNVSRGDDVAAGTGPTDPPVIADGAVSSGSVEVDGTSVEYVTSVPAGFEAGATAPVLLALPPGAQDLAVTRRLVDSTYASEAQRLGWVVVSPRRPMDSASSTAANGCSRDFSTGWRPG